MMDWLDEQLGKITMYRLVLYSLIGLSVVGFILMASGHLDFSPFSFAVSIVVMSAMAYVSNRLFGWLFGVKPHSESAFITALILVLLFIPPSTVIDFVKLGLVAVIAMASKYIVAVRGRHIFNPAAIAIVIASISGLAYAGWWIATPAMIPVTIIAGFFILRRTKKQFTSLAFVLIAMVSLFFQGTNPVTAFVSWPLLFVGAIMLTEPLTLPPRASQQYIVAAVVGVLMTLPLQYGRITMTPALALVIGNVVGWWFGQRRGIKLRYVGRKQMSGSTHNFTFDTEKLQFTPGQYIELTLVHPKSDSRGHRRVFSIASAPGSDQINIGTKLPTKPSSFKKALMNLKPGDIVHATRVSGDFVLPEDTKRPVVLIAGGIGVTPFMSFIESSQRPLQLIYAVGDTGDLSYVDQLKQHAVDVVVVSPDHAKLPDPEWLFVHGYLNKKTLETLLDVDEQPLVYISGPPGMVTSARKVIKAMGIKHIKVDEFSGY